MSVVMVALEVMAIAVYLYYYSDLAKQRLGPFGMYRNHSLSTELDKSRVLDNSKI